MATQKVTLKIDGDSSGAVNAIGGVSAKSVALGNIMADLARGAVDLLGKAMKEVSDQLMKAVDAAAEQEKAQKMLAAAMAQAGTYTEQAFKHNLDYASSLQKNTVYGDDEINSVQRLLTNYKLQGDVLDKTTKAVLDLATAKGMDLTSAANLVARAVSGESDNIGKLNISMEGATGATERARKAVAGITELFGGTAQSEANTFSGKIKQLGNIWNDLQEEVGDVIIKNKGLMEIFNILQKAIEDATKWVTNHKEMLGNLVKDGIVFVIKSLSILVQGINLASWAWGEMGNMATKSIEGIAKILSGYYNLQNMVLGKVLPASKQISDFWKGIADAGKETLEQDQKAQEKRMLMFDEIVSSIDAIAAKVAATKSSYNTATEGIVNVTKAQEDMGLVFDFVNSAIMEQLDIWGEEEKARTQELIDLARGYTDAELQEYERRKEGLFNLVQSGQITYEQYTDFIAKNGAKFVATNKKTSDDFKNNWQQAWSITQQAATRANEDIIKNQTTFGTALENATKQSMKAYLKLKIDAAIQDIAIEAAKAVGIATVEGVLSFGATLLMIPIITAAQMAAGAALNALIPSFDTGGMVGPGGIKLPLPSFASAGSGAPAHVIAHEGEVIGTPATLAGAGIGGVNVYFNNYGAISSLLDVDEIGSRLGQSIKNTLKGAI